jgi:hypothetical protein
LNYRSGSSNHRFITQHMSTVSATGKDTVPAKRAQVPPPPTPPAKRVEKESSSSQPPDNTPPSDSETDDDSDIMSNDGRAKVNPPEVFKGERGQLKSFLTQSALYIYWNPKQFQDEERQVMFMVSYMRGIAYTWIESRLREYLDDPDEAPTETKRLFESLKHFRQQLKLVFGNVDETRTADRELHSIRQKTSAADYAANFQRVASSLSWDDVALCSQFFSGLKWEVKDDILRREEQPETLAKMIEVAIKTDNRIYESYLEKKGQGTRKNFSVNQNKKRNAPYYGPMPMELDKLQKGNGRDKGRRESTQKGNCYNCGKPGHYANKCRQPKKRTFGPAGHPERLGKLQRGEPVVIAMLQTQAKSDESEDSSVEESGAEDGQNLSENEADQRI